MKKNLCSKIWMIPWCLLLLFSVNLGLQNAYASSHRWELTAEGWKVRTADTGNYLAAQWIFLDGKWYYLDAAGVMQIGWQQVKDKWYYLWPNGTMATGWVLIEETDQERWYFFEQSGTMATGWKEIAGCWYYFGTDGDMAAETITPDGYWVNANGIWNSNNKKLSASGNQFRSGGHVTGGNSNSPDKGQADSSKSKGQEIAGTDPVVPNPKPVVPDQKEQPIASESNAELEQYLQEGTFFDENDQVKIDEAMRIAVSQTCNAVIFLSNDFYPYSQKLNRMEYKEVQKFSLSHKQIIAEDKTYYITIYQIDYADMHRDTIQERQASGCQSWGYIISRCKECHEIMDKVYMPPTGHVDTDGDLICDSCGILMDCSIGSKQKIRTNLAEPYNILEFTCIDSDYDGSMLFLSDTVIPYQAAVWFDGSGSNYTWSDARDWLNLNFYNGLSVAKYIKPIKLPDIEDDLPDKVFCLSKDEILSNAAWTMIPWNGQSSRFYWSRTADDSKYVYAVHCSGHIASEVKNSTEAGIRPAYAVVKTKAESIISPVWFEEAKQLRQRNGENHIFTCVNPDYLSITGKRGALFYTDQIMSETETAVHWMEKIENQFGILEFEPYIDKEGIHPGFIVEQR